MLGYRRSRRSASTTAALRGRFQSRNSLRARRFIWLNTFLFFVLTATTTTTPLQVPLREMEPFEGLDASNLLSDVKEMVKSDRVRTVYSENVARL